MSTAATTPPRFADGALVHVKGTDDQVLALYGHPAVGTVGTIVRRSHRSNGMHRYLVSFPEHTYTTPIRKQTRTIRATTCMIREDHLELAVQPKTAEVPV